MAEIGKINTLIITRILDDGAYLDGGDAGDVILPKKYVDKDCQLGDKIKVFVYVDREKRLRATTQKPHATVGQFAQLRVVANSSSGSYLDWGLQKDLLVPKREQQNTMEEGKSYIVFIFLDKNTNRVTASSKIEKFLSFQSPDFDEGQQVDLFICEKTNLGYKVIVNNAHWGMVYQNEVFQNIHIGQQLKGYIKTIREDLKIDISLQQSGFKRVDTVSQGILTTIKERGGSISLTDKSPPEDIYSQFGISKKVFKKAIGALYKRRLITIDTNGIKLAKNKKKSS